MTEASENNRRAAQGLPRALRVTSPRLFAEIYARGRKAAGALMVAWANPGIEGRVRLGVVAGRKVGKAVERNRAKRRLREMFRTTRALLRPGCDWILVARRPLLGATAEETRAELLRLAKKLDKLKTRGAAGDAGEDIDSVFDAL